MEHGKPSELDPTAPLNQESEFTGIEINPDENVELLTNQFRMANIAVERAKEKYGENSPQHVDANYFSDTIGRKLSKIHNKRNK